MTVTWANVDVRQVVNLRYRNDYGVEHTARVLPLEVKYVVRDTEEQPCWCLLACNLDKEREVLIPCKCIHAWDAPEMEAHADFPLPVK